MDARTRSNLHFARLPNLKTMINPLDGRRVHTMEVSKWLGEGHNASNYYYGYLTDEDIPPELLEDEVVNQEGEPDGH